MLVGDVIAIRNVIDVCGWPGSGPGWRTRSWNSRQDGDQDNVSQRSVDSVTVGRLE